MERVGIALPVINVPFRTSLIQLKNGKKTEIGVDTQGDRSS